MEVLFNEVPASAIAAAVVGAFVVLAVARNNEPNLWALGRTAAATSLTIGSLVFGAMVVGVGIGLARGDADQDRRAFFFVAALTIVAAALGAAVILKPGSGPTPRIGTAPAPCSPARSLGWWRCLFV